MGRLVSNMQGVQALWLAQTFGDFSLLAQRLEKGIAIKGELKLAADLITGRIRRPKHRLPILRGWRRDEAIDNFVICHLAKFGGKKEAVVAAAMALFDMKRSSIHDALKRAKARR